jgi:hypothetical protein
VVEDALDAFIAALNIARLQVVLARAFARALVSTHLALGASGLCPREVREASHPPNAANAVVIIVSWILVVPWLIAHATQVVEEHGCSCIVLRLDELVEGNAGAVRRWDRWIIVDCSSAKFHVLDTVASSLALPLDGFQPWEVVETWKDRIYAVLLPADGV